MPQRKGPPAATAKSHLNYTQGGRQTWEVLASAGQIPEAIGAIVAERDHVTFCEVQVALEAYLPVHGDCAIELRPNLFLWVGLSVELVRALRQAHDGGLIHFHPASTLLYAIDGAIPRIPVARRTPPPQGFKKPRWLPVMLRPIPMGSGKRAGA